MHLDEEQVQRLLHGELSGAGEASARGHLAACAECRAGVAAAEREERDLHVLLRHLDHAPPGTDLRTLVAAARGRARGWVRWAAGLALVLGLGGVAYAAPGSPVRAWVRALVGTIVPARPEDAGPAGIAVAPGPRLVIAFTSRQADGRVEVALRESGDVVVRAPMGAATYTSDAERLVIDNAGSAAAFAIDIPRDAARVEILVAGARVFLKEGARAGGDPPARCVAVDAGRFSCSMGGP